MTTTQQPAAPVAPLPMPQQGGAWVRLPDGSLQREAPEPEPEPEPPNAPTEE